MVVMRGGVCGCAGDVDGVDLGKSFPNQGTQKTKKERVAPREKRRQRCSCRAMEKYRKIMFTRWNEISMMGLRKNSAACLWHSCSHIANLAKSMNVFIEFEKNRENYAPRNAREF